MFRAFFKHPNAFRIWIGVCLIGLVLAGTSANWRIIRNRNVNKHIVEHLGHGGYFLYECSQSLKAAIEEKRLATSDAQPYREFLQKVREANVAARSERTGEHTKPKNVIFLQMESVDGLSVRARLDGQPLMPFLYELRNRVVDFPNTADNTSAGRTTDGEFLVLASLPPVLGKPVYSNYDLSLVPSLPRVLNDAGYYTFSIHGYTGAFWNRANAHRELGYQESFFQADLDGTDKLGWGVSDHAVLQQAVDKIVASEAPVFAHIILLTNHHPYHHLARSRGEKDFDVLANHIESLLYVDEAIEAFFGRLEAEGALNDCLIGIYSDHDSSIAPLLHETVDLDQPALLVDTVPLMLFGFDHPPQRIEKVAALQDLPVILLDALGITPPTTFVGNAIQSKLPTLTFNNQLLSKSGDQLIRQPAPIEVGVLTKLAILHPEKLKASP